MTDLCPAHGTDTCATCPGCQTDAGLMDYEHGHARTFEDSRHAVVMLRAIHNWEGSGLCALADMTPQEILHAADLLPKLLPGHVDGAAPMAYLVVLLARALKAAQDTDSGSVAHDTAGDAQE